MKIILKKFVNKDNVWEYWIVVIENGMTQSKLIDKDTYESIRYLNKAISKNKDI